MAASSFTHGRLMSLPVDLDQVDLKLHWNPYTRDREATPLSWDADTISDSAQQNHIIPAAAANFDERFANLKKRIASWDTDLKNAKQCAEASARRLAECHEGRVLLDAEDPGEYATVPEYWYARAACYRIERERLMEEQEDQDSRSPTPGYVPPEFFGETELERAKGSAELAAECLARLPAGKAVLEAEDHGDSSTDPTYWWSKEKYYRAEFYTIYEKTKLQRAKGYADCIARDLATFPAGKALIKAEVHEESAMDPVYWRSKKKYYKAEYDKLEGEFWNRWKRTYLSGEGFPAEALNDSKSKRGVLQSSANPERHTTRSTPSTIQRRKETKHLQSVAIASSPIRYAGAETADGRSAGRRKSKDRYRRRKAQVAKRKPSSPPPGWFAAQEPLNGHLNPNSDERRTRRSGTRSRCKNPAQRRRKVKHSSPDGRQRKFQPPSQSGNPYLTPSFPDSFKSKARQRRKYKGAARQKRRWDADSTYHGSRAVSQPEEPISSRLRSGGVFLKGAL